MKKQILYLVLISVFIMSFSYGKKAKFRPPGTAQIVDNFFFDVRELTNMDWREYLSYLKVNHGEETEIYKNALPDTTVWKSEFEYSEPFVENYFQHPSYNDYPVVGVSHQQAKDYCKWRTEAVKTMLKTNNFEGPKALEYRLPTRSEWELIARGGYDKKALRIMRKQKKKNGQANRTTNMIYQSDSPSATTKPKNMMVAPSRTYLPNKYGVYNIFGNVAEMIAEPGVAMGGSWKHTYEDIVPSNESVNYDTPNSWLGFRCVCEVTQ